MKRQNGHVQARPERTSLTWASWHLGWRQSRPLPYRLHLSFSSCRERLLLLRPYLRRLLLPRIITCTNLLVCVRFYGCVCVRLCASVGVCMRVWMSASLRAILWTHIHIRTHRLYVCSRIMTWAANCLALGPTLPPSNMNTGSAQMSVKAKFSDLCPFFVAVLVRANFVKSFLTVLYKILDAVPMWWVWMGV